MDIQHITLSVSWIRGDVADGSHAVSEVEDEGGAILIESGVEELEIGEGDGVGEGQGGAGVAFDNLDGRSGQYMWGCERRVGCTVCHDPQFRVELSRALGGTIAAVDA